MDKRNSGEIPTISLKDIDLNSNPGSKHRNLVSSSLSSSRVRVKKPRPPSLVNLCLGVMGKHLEDIIPYLAEIVYTFPVDIKMTIAAIARRRKLLDDDVIVSLTDSSWEILDISGSDITDAGLAKVAEMCKSLQAVDISRCNRITSMGVTELVHHCRSLETLRCGGCPRSESTARSCLSIFKPNLSEIEGDSWEELYTTELGHGGQSLRWLVWPTIDTCSSEMLKTECPRIVLNPAPSLIGYKGQRIPGEALPNVVMDEAYVKYIDPKAWANGDENKKEVMVGPYGLRKEELSVAEKFRIAFEERDARLAPKRAKNARQHQRRAERDRLMSSSQAKAFSLALLATRPNK